MRRITIGDRELSSLTEEEYEDLVSVIHRTLGLRLVGWVGAIDGTTSLVSPNFAWGDPVHITTQRDVQFGG